MTKDLYQILGISRNASAAEIKKAYRKKSLENHPDKFSDKSQEEQKAAAERMQEINQAYSILSDEKKKSVYDMTGDVDSAEHGQAGNPFGMDFGSFDMNDIFGSFFGGGSRRSSSRAQERVIPGKDLRVRIKIGIDELFNPKDHKIKYKRDVRCEVCHGAGGETKECPRCHGTGRIVETIRDGFAVMQTQKDCPDCHGTGRIITKKCQNKNCVDGFVKKDAEKTIQFPPGVGDGEYMVFETDGCEAKKPGHPNGRLIAFAEYAFDKNVYEVNECDVTQKIIVPYEDCILGTKCTFTHPSGKDISFNIAPLTESGKKFLFRGLGLKRQNAYGRIETGNYIVEICYGLPDELSDREKELLEEIKKERESREEKKSSEG